MVMKESKTPSESTCCMCFEDGAMLNELTKIDNTPGVIEQANLLLALGFKDTDKFCEECFWK